MSAENQSGSRYDVTYRPEADLRLSMSSLESSVEMQQAARQELKPGEAAAGFRRLATRFGLNKTALGWLAADVYENVQTPEMQTIWHWDFAGNGNGLSDRELDALLAHLVLKGT